MALLASDLRARSLRSSDVQPVLELINADRLPGQPMVTEAMLGDAVSGRSEVDAGWWAELDALAVDVLVDGDDHPAGVVSYAARSRDNAGVILWLHGRENQVVVETLIERSLRAFGRRDLVEAFAFSSALTAGLEALPVRHRGVTAHVLHARGFVAEDLWRYMHRLLPATGLPLAAGVAVNEADGGHHKLVVHDGEQLTAEADVSVPFPGIGVLWWLEVHPHARQRGLGMAMLGSALHQLERLGAAEVVLYVDDDAPADDEERGRCAANRLYDRAGFNEIDRLHSFRLRN